ncbi:hypothetical protein EYR41_001056 [Orbilia oligospora]|uniref:Attractin/MKLN-like beta-propeller domain-containing protein n=1 Tax=Orbilia oligospora TaxID=2813651 RepID=A0A7C8P340_ORBOL|nr:hypothetical protein TWF751_003602 [Orbilia oligospora]KAF3283527.1 hypothetical protein TWF132_010330 [Orbilia oligospora]TGJ74001.1 hypothetical protein EYR41_001056 [Orbilia oligospora]
MSQDEADPVRDSCSLTGHSGLVIGDILYILGGRMIYNWEIGWGGYGQNPYLRVLDLTSTVRMQDIGDQIEVVKSNIKPFNWDGEILPDTRSPMFWLDTAVNKAYLALGAYMNIENTSYIGGREWNPGKPGKLWTADVAERNILTNWTESDLKINGRDGSLVGTAASWFDEESRMGYAFGGAYIESSEFAEPVNQLLTFNARTGTWKNESTPYSQTASGWMHGIKLEGRTVLLAGMGVTNGQQGSVDLVRIYDTNSTQWYTQRTNGTPPQNRFWSGCSILVASQDKSSYQIIVFGGANNEETFGDVWALSIPSFTWTKLSDDIDSNVAAAPRYSPSCNLVKKHMMVVFGGNRVIGGSTYNYPQCDKDGKLAFFFDLNLLEWASVVSEEEPEEYRVPEMIYETIGGNANGGATLTQPPGGFNQAGMSTVFAAFASTTSTAPASTTTSTMETTSSAPSASSSPALSGGAIGGIVAGAIILIALVAVGIWFYLRKRREPEELATPSPPPPPTDPNKGWIQNPSELQGPYVEPIMELHGSYSAVNAELPGNQLNPYPFVLQHQHISQGPYEAPA